ncbi:hypothetical protein ACHAWF_006773 [Thalassiosira exigua]
MHPGDGACRIGVDDANNVQYLQAQVRRKTSRRAASRQCAARNHSSCIINMRPSTMATAAPTPTTTPPRPPPHLAAPDLHHHRLYLRALVRQERSRSYRRRDYLSPDWQARLWRDEVKGRASQGLGHVSPSSVADPFGPGESEPDRPDAPSEISVRWREKIVEWKYQIVDRFDLNRELVGVSAHYLDQYLSLHYVDEELFQLAAMASIYLAIKIHSPKKVTVRSIASTGNGLVSARHIESMELAIMRALDWHLHPPTTVAFLENIFPLIAQGTDLDDHSDQGQRVRRGLEESLEFSRFLSELSVCAYPFVSADPSSVALAAASFSLEYFDLPPSTKEALRSAARSASLDARSNEVEACGRLLRKVYRLAMPGDKRVPGA